MEQKLTFLAIAMMAPFAGCGIQNAEPEVEEACVSLGQAREATLAELRHLAPMGLVDGDYRISEDTVSALELEDLIAVSDDEYLEGRWPRSYSFDLNQEEVDWRITASYDRRCRMSLSWGRLGK